MSKKEKLLKRLMSRPKDFTWNELTTLLGAFGYEIVSMGKTGGSRRKFLNTETNHAMFFHEPHPSGILKAYQVKNVIENLKEEKLI